MTARQEVTRFCKMYGIKVDGKHGVPMLSKGELVDCFDSWEQVRAFLLAQRDAMQLGKRSAWMA